METVTGSIPGCSLYFPPRRASEIPMGRGSKRRQFPRGWGQILKVFFSRDFEKRIIVFIDDFTLTVIAECFFHSLPVWYSLHVYECHRLMNYDGHPAHCFIFHNNIVKYINYIIILLWYNSLLWSCSTSLLLTCLSFTGSFIDAIIAHWTKLFWIDVILYKNKTSQGTSIIFFSFEVYQIPHMGKYFHVDHARRTCITAYPNMVMKSQRYGKSRDF